MKYSTWKQKNVKFTAGDRTPYTYRVKCLVTGKSYYGVRFAEGCHPEDFWKTYFTSSCKIKKELKRYGKDNFLPEVRRVFNTAAEAKLWEEKVLRRLVVPNDRWYNWRWTRLPSGSPKPYLGHKHSPETRARMSAIRKLKVGLLNPLHGKRMPESVLRAAARASKEVVMCPKCGASGGKGAFKRFHFENCHFLPIPLCACGAAAAPTKRSRGPRLYNPETYPELARYRCPKCSFKARAQNRGKKEIRWTLAKQIIGVSGNLERVLRCVEANNGKTLGDLAAELPKFVQTKSPRQFLSVWNKRLVAEGWIVRSQTWVK